MWNAETGFFYTGTTPDSAPIHTSPLPEDLQAWSFLALRERRFASALDWAKTNLATTDSPQLPNARFSENVTFRGVTFSNVSLQTPEPTGQFDPPADPDAVWYWAPARWRRHNLMDTIITRVGQQDSRATKASRDTILIMYSKPTNTWGTGRPSEARRSPMDSAWWPLPGSSSVLNTGFGFSYSSKLHIGATS